MLVEDAMTAVLWPWGIFVYQAGMLVFMGLVVTTYSSV